MAQDFYTQVDAAKAAKGFSGSSETPSSLAGAVKNGKRTVVLAGAGLLGLLILYVMWPSGGSYGYDGAEETEHFISVSGTQVRLQRPIVALAATLAASQASADTADVV